MMSNAHGQAHMRMNNRQFEALYDGRRRSYHTEVYNKLLEQQTTNALILQGEIMGAVSIASKIYPSRLCRSVQQVEDDDAFCRLIYRFTLLNDTEISIRAKTQ